jgi:hypothetical protein
MNTPVRSILLLACSAIVIAACSVGAAPRPSAVPASDPPAASPGGSTGGGAGGGSTGQPGIGIDLPALPWPADPGLGEPTLVFARPGRLDPHPVGATRIEARVDARKVVLRLTWWSGVEPCSVLDSVGVARTGSDIVVTIREGADKLDVACIELAMLKATIVDLGELEPGTYTISAGGDAPSIQVVVR